MKVIQPFLRRRWFSLLCIAILVALTMIDVFDYSERGIYQKSKGISNGNLFIRSELNWYHFADSAADPFYEEWSLTHGKHYSWPIYLWRMHRPVPGEPFPSARIVSPAPETSYHVQIPLWNLLLAPTGWIALAELRRVRRKEQGT